jgi:hypothetical protein
MRLVVGHVLEREDALARLAFEHAVDHQQRIALRQILQDFQRIARTPMCT